MDSGFIKIHRKILDWEWYDNPDTFRLFMHLLFKANYEDRTWKGKIIKKGSLITSRSKLSEETGLSEMKIRNQLNNLQTTNEITIKSTKHYTIIELVKWNYYNQQNNQQKVQQTTDKLSTLKEIKKIKNIEDSSIDVSNDEVYMQAGHLSITHDEFSKLEKEFGAEKSDEIIHKILNYRKNTKYKSLYLTAINWLRRDEKKQTSVAKLVQVTTTYD